jgi:hypothetical protein
MQVVSWVVVKINCHIYVGALLKWQYILVYYENARYKD